MKTQSNHPHTRARAFILAAVASALPLFGSACSSTDAVQPGPTPPRGIVVLDGFVQPGFTLVGDTGTATTKLSLGATTEFDAGLFTLERDTALAVSSRGAGDLLYIADLRAGTVRKVQLPVGGNGAKARLLTGGNGSTRVLVALRDSQMVVNVLVPAGSGAPTITRIEDVGRCPSDAFRFEGATWVVDANANCRSDYAIEGAVRLIRVPDGGGARDTLVLSSLRGSGANAIVDGEVAYVSAGGDANFSAFPYTLLTSGAVAKIDLRARQVLMQKSMPVGTYEARTKLGLDGSLYVSLYEDLNTFGERVVQLRTDNLSIAATGATSAEGWRLLTDPNDNEVSCNSATADALGRIHCLVPGGAAATHLVVFDEGGAEVRRVAVGQGGVDLALRP